MWKGVSRVSRCEKASAGGCRASAAWCLVGSMAESSARFAPAGSTLAATIAASAARVSSKLYMPTALLKENSPAGCCGCTT